MEFDENIRKLCREFGGFSSATSVNEKCRRLKPYFKKASENGRAKMLFFLVLNTDHKFNFRLKDSYDVGFLIGMCPTLSLEELCDIIVNLELICALSDIVSSCPVDISVEILCCLHDHILKTENKYEHFRKLALALHDKYNKIFGFLADEPLMDIFDIFLMFLPSLCRSNIASEESLLAIICQLQIWKDCLSCRKISDNPIFSINFNNVITEPKVVEVNSPIGRTGESFSEFLSHLKFLVDSNVLDGDDSPLKRTIHENLYLLYGTIKKRNILKPDEEKWLKAIMREPETENISDYDIDTIIDKISNFETDRKWFTALINFPNWLEKEEAVVCAMTHLHVMDVEDLRRVVECVQSVKCDLVTNKLNNIYLDCLERLPLNDQISYFNRHFEQKRNFSWETAEEEVTEKFNKMSDSDVSNEKIKFWLIATCMKSPSKIIQKLCKRGLSNEAMLHESVEFLNMLRGGCLWRESEEEDVNIITSVLRSLIEDEALTPLEKHYLILFINELQEVKLLDFQFINVCILNVIRKGLAAEDFDKVILALELFKSSVKWKSVVRSKEVALAAFTVRILSHASWDCTTFSMQLVHARELLIPIAESLIKSSNSFSGSEEAWLRQEILKSSEVNQLCFCDFLFPDSGKAIASKELYIQLLALLHTKSEVHFIIDSVVNKFQSRKFLELRLLFSLALIKIIPILITKEWTTLFIHLKSIVEAWLNTQINAGNFHSGLVVVDLLTLSMYCLAQDMNLFGDMSACFEFCVRNYGKVLSNFISEKPFAANVRVDLAKKILFLLNGIQDSSSRKANSVILSCVLLEATGRRNGNPPEHSEELRDLEDWFRKDFIQ